MLAVLVAIAGGAAVVALSTLHPLSPPPCSATVDGVTYRLERDQAANARTIAEVGARAGLPHHAVTIALAAALQESQLQNLNGGDRDSVGLFQQRPSAGWGTRAQLLDAQFAAGAFYQALGRVPGWQTMAVTEAAQAVQRSAAPHAYASWEPEARTLARILTHEVPNRIVCR